MPVPLIAPNLIQPVDQYSSGLSSFVAETLPAVPVEPPATAETTNKRLGSDPEPLPGSYGFLRKRLQSTAPSDALMNLAEEYQRNHNQPHRPNAKQSLNRDDIENFSARSANIWVDHFKDLQFSNLDPAKVPFHEFPLELASMLCSVAPEATEAKLREEGYHTVYPLALKHYIQRALRQKVLPNATLKKGADFPEILHCHAETYFGIWTTFNDTPLSSDLITLLEKAESTYSYDQDLTADKRLRTFLRERAIEDIANFFTERHTHLLCHFNLEVYLNDPALLNLDTYYFDPIVVIDTDPATKKWVFAAERKDYRLSGIQKALVETMKHRLEKAFPQNWETHLEIVEEARERAQNRLEMTRLAKQLASGAAKLANSASTVAQFVFGAPVKFW